MSLLYECIHTVIVGGMLGDASGLGGDTLAKLCIEKLTAFLDDGDQNREFCHVDVTMVFLSTETLMNPVRYIALLALNKILPSHPYLFTEYHDAILSLIDDVDLSIRLRALDLVEGMVDRHNLTSIVSRLTSHHLPSTSAQPPRALSSLRNIGRTSSAAAGAAEPSLSPAYKTQLANLILNISSRSTYANVSNFEWYIDVLAGLSRLCLDSTLVGEDDRYDDGKERDGEKPVVVDVNRRIADILMDVCARVKAVRPYAAEKMARLIGDKTFLEGTGEEVAGAAAWIVGEYGRYACGLSFAFFVCVSDGQVPPPLSIVR
jgi:AP-3 complex subunit delta-1